MKTVKKISKAKFKVTTEDVANSELLLDFNPLIDQFDLKGDFYIIHWQARPKGHREWGIYSIKDDTYTSSVEFPSAFGKMELKMLDDATANSIPSAVVLFTGHLKI